MNAGDCDEIPKAGNATLNQ
ncbi:hypothetical protein NPIL_244971, partial [Nephila pilipes]